MASSVDLTGEDAEFLDQHPSSVLSSQNIRDMHSALLSHMAMVQYEKSRLDAGRTSTVPDASENSNLAETAPDSSSMSPEPPSSASHGEDPQSGTTASLRSTTSTLESANGFAEFSPSQAVKTASLSVEPPKVSSLRRRKVANDGGDITSAPPSKEESGLRSTSKVSFQVRVKQGEQQHWLSWQDLLDQQQKAMREQRFQDALRQQQQYVPTPASSIYPSWFKTLVWLYLIVLITVALSTSVYVLTGSEKDIMRKAQNLMQSVERVEEALETMVNLTSDVMSTSLLEFLTKFGIVEPTFRPSAGDELQLPAHTASSYDRYVNNIRKRAEDVVQKSTEVRTRVLWTNKYMTQQNQAVDPGKFEPKWVDGRRVASVVQVLLCTLTDGDEVLLPATR